MTKYKKKWKCLYCNKACGIYLNVYYRNKPESPNDSTGYGMRMYCCEMHFQKSINEFIKKTSNLA